MHGKRSEICDICLVIYINVFSRDLRKGVKTEVIKSPNNAIYSVSSRVKKMIKTFS